MIRRRCSFKKYAWNVVSGKSPLIINNSERDRFRSFSIIGNTEQLTTTGKNLFDIEKAKKAESYETVSIGGVEYKAIVYNVTPNTDYTLSVSSKASGKITNLNIGNTTTRYSLITNGITKRNINSLKDGLIYVFFSEGTVEANIEIFYKQYFEIQLETGKVRTPYEPYTGGKPSPSPEYPQEIKNVGKRNEEKQKYEVDVKLTGRNLFDKNIILPKNSYDTFEGGYYRKYFYLPPNMNFTMYINHKNESLLGQSTTFIATGIPAYDNTDGNGLVPLFNKTSTVEKLNFTTPNDGKMILKIASYANENNIKMLMNQTDIMICPQTENPKYVEYQFPQTITLTSDRPITKWDKLVEQDGQIGWLFNRKIALIPKTGWLYNEIGFFYKANFFPDANISITPMNETSIFTHFVLGNPQSNKGKDVAWLYVPEIGKGVLRVGVSSETIVTPEEFEKYISDKDMKILYELAEPEFIPLPQSEQDAIRALKTYYTTTVIAVDGGEVIPSVEVQCAIKEM